MLLYTGTTYYIVERRLYLNDITELLKGVLEGCVLEYISRNPTYGYEITQQLHALGFSEVVEGTVYTILVRLEKSKLIHSTKQPSTLGPPRKFYSLTELGVQELELFWEKWTFISSKLTTLKES